MFEVEDVCQRFLFNYVIVVLFVLALAAKPYTSVIIGDHAPSHVLQCCTVAVFFVLSLSVLKSGHACYVICKAKNDCPHQHADLVASWILY